MSREPTNPSGKIINLNAERPDRTAPKHLSVLFVEDDEIDASLIELSLSKSTKFAFEITRARSVDETRDLLGAAAFDLMLLDYWLGSDSGLELLRLLGGRHGRLPVILLTGHSNQDIQRLGHNAGAVSFLSKDDVSPTTLETVIQSTLHTHRLESELLWSINQRDTALRTQFDLLADISRSVDAPLQGICDASEAIGRLSGQNDKAATIAAQTKAIAAHVKTLRKTVNRLIDQVRTDQSHVDLKLEFADLADLVDKALRLVFRQLGERRQSTVFKRPDVALPIKADRTAILQALLNIISNAGQSSPSGSQIAVDLAVDGTEAVATVSDRGPGMTRDEIATALQPLPRRSLQEGDGAAGEAGMGLSIASGIAEAHDGEIAIESDPDTGTRVSLRLPLRP